MEGKEYMDLLGLVTDLDQKVIINNNLSDANYLQSISRGIDNFTTEEDKNLYTLHSLPHIKTVIKNISELITQENFLSFDDRKLLTISVLYHDIGMKINRFKHAEESVNILKAPFRDPVNNEIKRDQLIHFFTKKESDKNIIYDTIESHTLSKHAAKERIKKHNENSFAIEKLICLLRIGDILDCTKNRLDDNTPNIPFSSYLHWKKHKLISNVEFQKGEKKAIIFTNTESIKHNWEYEFIETEFGYIKDEFSFAQEQVKDFSENCIFNISLSSQFYEIKKQFTEQKQTDLEFAPYSRIEDSAYYNLFGRKQIAFDILHSVFSRHKSTIIYGRRGVGKSSLLKCKICNILDSLKQDKISFNYVEDYENIENLFKNINTKQIIIFDQFEKVLLNDNKKEIFSTEIEKLKKNNDIRFLFSVPTEKLEDMISLNIINDDSPKILIERLSTFEAMKYVSSIMQSDEKQENTIKEIISYLRANPIDNITFNNRLNILFSYIKKGRDGKIPSLDTVIKEKMLNKSIKEYHNNLFKANTEEQKQILNRFITRNNRIITLLPQNETENRIFKELKKRHILRNIADNNSNARYEFIHAQLLDIYRKEYCTDKDLKDKINLEEELEKAYREKANINSDSLSKIIIKYNANNILFGNEEDAMLKESFHNFIIEQLLKNNNATKIVIEKYGFKAKTFSEILWGLLYNEDQKQIYNTYIKYRNLFKRFYATELPKDINRLSIQEILHHIFIAKIEDLQLEISDISNEEDPRLYYLTDEIRSEIIELIYFNKFKSNILHLEESDDILKKYRDYIKGKKNGNNIFQSICKSFDLEKLNNLILIYFKKFYLEKEEEMGTIIIDNNNNVCFQNTTNKTLTDLQLSSEQKLIVLSFSSGKVFCHRKDDKIIALSSKTRTIKYYTKHDIFKFLLNIKLSRDERLPLFSKSHIFNAKWSKSLNNIIDKIKNKEDNIPIKLSKMRDNDDLYEVTDEDENDGIIYYHKSFSIERETAKINLIKNNAIKVNENDSPLLIIIIGKEDKIFEEKYQNIVSFYVYFDDRISLVSQVIDAWCYEIMKIKRILDENANIRKIFIITPENHLSQENASRFLLEENKDNLIETDESFKELKIYSSKKWNELLENTTIETATKDNFDEKLYDFFCFEEKNYNQPIISKATINSEIDVPISIKYPDKNNCNEDKIITSNTFSKAYINIIKKIDKYGLEVGATKEIIGLTVQISNPIEALNKLLEDKSFYRYNEIDKYYQEQWLHPDGKIFQYIYDKFGVNQLEMVNSLIYNSIINDQSTRKGAFTFYFPDLNKLEKIDSLFSCFIIMRYIESNQTYDLNPYFIWRSNECVFGILLSLVNSIRWFKTTVFDELKKQLSEKRFEMSKYYYHGINMHMDNNYLINNMINQIFNEININI